jgi:transcriptional regulator with XRE-family HTH domain
MEEAGQKLKRVRERLGLRFRDVEEASAKIASRRGNDEFMIPLSRLADIENKGTIPSLYRLYSLCAIYHIDFHEVLSWYGISVAALASDSGVIEHTRTHAVGFRPPEEGSVQVPIALDPGLDLSRTVYLSRFIQRWGTVPLILLGSLDLKNYRYGLIGTEDWFMWPLVPPGSLVVIDDTKRKIIPSGWTNEYERPIYFLEHRGGYVCAWCALKDDQLIVQPHPASDGEPEFYEYPEEIEVVGQVTRIALTLDRITRRGHS